VHGPWWQAVPTTTRAHAKEKEKKHVVCVLSCLDVVGQFSAGAFIHTQLRDAAVRWEGVKARHVFNIVTTSPPPPVMPSQPMISKSPHLFIK